MLKIPAGIDKINNEEMYKDWWNLRLVESFEKEKILLDWTCYQGESISKDHQRKDC